MGEALVQELPPFFSFPHKPEDNMANETFTTELEAVNTIISTIGESKVNTLTGELPVEVAVAKDLLVEMSRAVQQSGWHFNTEYELTLARDVDNKVALPQNCLKVDLSAQDWSIDPVQRGVRLYDAQNRTYVFTSNPIVDIVYFLPWDDLIEQARRYILIRAAKLFSARMVGAQELWTFTADEEMRAYIDLSEADGSSADYNIFQSMSMGRIINRREPSAGVR
jgi:hypothetical protein